MHRLGNPRDLLVARDSISGLMWKGEVLRFSFNFCVIVEKHLEDIALGMVFFVLKEVSISPYTPYRSISQVKRIVFVFRFGTAFSYWLVPKNTLYTGVTLYST